MSPEFHPVREGHRIILAKAALDDPKLRFRREVEKVAQRNNGVLSVAARYLLNRKSQELGISSSEATEIIQEVLLPYVEYAKKLQEYEQVLREMIAEKFPFSTAMEVDMEDYESYLGLRTADQSTIKERILAPKQAEYKQQLQAAERLKQQQAELLRQQQLEVERRQRQQEAAANSTPPSIHSLVNEYNGSHFLVNSNYFKIEASVSETDGGYKNRRDGISNSVILSANNQGKYQVISVNPGNKTEPEYLLLPIHRVMINVTYHSTGRALFNCTNIPVSYELFDFILVKPARVTHHISGWELRDKGEIHVIAFK